MMTEQDRFNDVLVEIAQDMMSSITNTPQAGGSWNEVIMDVRYEPKGTSWLRKLRLKLANGTIVALDTSVKSSLLLKELASGPVPSFPTFEQA
jgi:hypothetical protein